MSGQHTPGPWRVSKAKARRVTSEHGIVICNAVLRNQGGPKHKAFMKDELEAEANARLTAAAPELLEALEAAEQLHRDGLLNSAEERVAEVHALRRSAITKATGAE